MQPSNIAGSDLLRVRLSEGNRQLLGIDDLSDACSRGQTSIKISQLIQQDDVVSINKTDSFRRSALHYAAMKGRKSVCKLLINNGFDANKDDIHGSYPLHLAIQCNHYDAAIEICKASKPNLVNYKRENAVLILSKQKYHPKMNKLLSILIEHGNNIDLEDCRKCTPLFYAVDKPSFLSQLIKNGVDINHKDDFGRIALFNAVYATNCKVVELLINAGSQLEIMDDFSHTPLMLAACFGGIKIMKLLIENGANINVMMRSNAWLMSPLSLSIRHENYQAAKLMVKYGADIDIFVGDEETIWDLLIAQKYDFDYTDYDDGDNDTIMNDNTKSEVNTSWKRVEHKLKSKRRNSLFQYMQKVEKERKMKSIVDTELVKNEQVPMDILHLIASPLKWY